MSPLVRLSSGSTSPLGDSIGNIQGGTLSKSGLNLGKAQKTSGPGFNLKSNMKLDGKIAGGGGKGITAGKKGGK